ncbi:hypothetical protein ScPMuIL_007586 [Solemya velum]
MATSESSVLPLVAGGIGGTVGAVLTCPLEVVKTRLQSSVAVFQPVYITPNVQYLNRPHSVNLSTCANCEVLGQCSVQGSTRSIGLGFCLRHIVENEGVRALFKGLGPNIVGVAPSRAIYFFSYANTKKYLNTVLTPDTPLVHIGSAVTAGVTACTATNPIWFVKTRLQLDQKRNDSLTCRQCVKNIYKDMGLKGFYKGITASYFGVTETVIHFVIYEAVKAKLLQYSNHDRNYNQMDPSDFLRFMLAGAISKTCATCIAYPHEVARTRLREEGSKYRTFIQTILLVAKENGYRGLYRGLSTQLIRQIPNTAIVMSTYEAVMYLFANKT